jgi:hypothetical protein
MVISFERCSFSHGRGFEALLCMVISFERCSFSPGPEYEALLFMVISFERCSFLPGPGFEALRMLFRLSVAPFYLVLGMMLYFVW